VSKQKSGRERRGGTEAGDAWGDVADAAGALERELRKFEQEAAAARKMSLDTRKALERAARAAGEAAQGQERVNAALATLVQAIQTARQRHEANALALQARGEQIRQRADALAPLHERVAAIGDEGRAVNVLVQQAAAMQKDAATEEQVAALVTFIEGIEERMSKLEGAARGLGQDSAQVSAADVAEYCDSLRQQVASARNRLGLLRRGLHDLLASRPAS
jgi:chromosome segregation ATPase